MRLLVIPTLLYIVTSASFSVVSAADSGTVSPGGLHPLITRANVLLAAGQFGDAVKVYSEAIDQSPSDYLLYYKRATAYFSLQRHSSALEDFDQVLALTSNTANPFDGAYLMKAKIHVREGKFAKAQAMIDEYLKANKAKGVSKEKDQEVEELSKDIKEGWELKKKTMIQRNVGHWTGCVETASQALRTSAHSLIVRLWRAECALAAEDIESAVGDLTRLSHLLPASTQLQTTIFRLSYFLLPPPTPGSTSSSGSTPLSTLKQCLHYDPDSKPCLSLRRMVKSFEKGFEKVEDMLTKDDWRGVIKLLVAPGGGKNGDLWRRWEEALADHVGTQENLLPLVASLNEAEDSEDVAEEKEKEKMAKKNKKAEIPMPLYTKISPQRHILVKALCKSYIHLADTVKASTEYRTQTTKWCDELLTLKGRSDDPDGLVGRGESLLWAEEWEQAIRTFEKAFEASGRSDRDIHQRLLKAQKLLKQSKQKDYYKVLGVARDADERTIKKAFRRAAKSAHPDKGGSEAKMAALNEAYGVLSSSELRARYDAGDDPNDPMAGAGGHPGGFNFHFNQGGSGHPFAQFFQQTPPGSHGQGQRAYQFKHGGQQQRGQGGFQFHFGG